MPFFDLHIHPTLKSLFSEDRPDLSPPLRKLSPWEDINVDLVNFLAKEFFEFDRILCSQSNLSQLSRVGCNLVGIAMYTPERELVEGIRAQAQVVGKIKIHLQPDKMEKLLNTSPFDILLHDDWQTLMNPASFGVQHKRVIPLQKKEDYQANDLRNIYAFFCVEGCHTLISSTRLKDLSDAAFKLDEILQNLDTLAQNRAILSLGLVHLTRSPVCNHADGVSFGQNERYNPVGFGLSNTGAKIARRCYQKGIMIDLKHMSLASRQQFYNLRRAPSFVDTQQPLICTHAGFTGISWGEIADYIFKFTPSNASKRLEMGKPVHYGGAGYPRPSFNAVSINLYDEDIAEILRSNGMIGLSMDKRILGYQLPNELADTYFLRESEYISNLESALFMKPIVGKAFGAGKCIDSQEAKAAYNSNDDLHFYHLLHFLAHVLHLVVVAQKNGISPLQALKCVCIGSDFDGVINPILACESIERLPYLQQEFEAHFERFAQASGVKLPDNFQVKEVSQDIFYRNGRDFLFRRMDAAQPKTA